MLKVLIVEDDYLYALSLKVQFEHEFREVEIFLIKSEKQFREDLKAIEEFAPDLIILDVMLRWMNAPHNTSSIPKDVEEMGSYRAGFRCLKSLSESHVFKDTPIIIHSVLGKDELQGELSNLPMNVFVSEKDISKNELFMYVRSVLRELPEENLKKKALLSKLVESSEIKPGWFGVRIDLKSLFAKKRKS